MELLHVGYQNYVNKSKVVSITPATSSPILRIRREAADRGMLVECSMGRKTKSLIHTSDGFVVTSAVDSATLSKRFDDIK